MGFTFGMAQMILYAIYRKPRGGSEVKLPQHKADIETVTKTTTSLESPEEHEKEGEGEEAAPASNGEHAPPALACSNDKYCMDNIQAPPMIRCEA